MDHIKEQLEITDLVKEKSFGKFELVKFKNLCGYKTVIDNKHILFSSGYTGELPEDKTILNCMAINFTCKDVIELPQFVADRMIPYEDFYYLENNSKRELWAAKLNQSEILVRIFYKFNYSNTSHNVYAGKKMIEQVILPNSIFNKFFIKGEI